MTSTHDLYEQLHTSLGASGRYKFVSGSAAQSTEQVFALSGNSLTWAVRVFVDLEVERIFRPLR